MPELKKGEDKIIFLELYPFNIFIELSETRQMQLIKLLQENLK